MSNIPNNRRKKRERLPLPFEKKKTDIVDWLYDKRVGLLSMAVVYLLIGIILVSSRIVVGGKYHQDFMFIELEELEQEQSDEQQEKLDNDRFQRMFGDVQNTESNENAELDAQLRDASGGSASDLYDEAERVQARMRANRDAYQQSLREQDQKFNNRNNQGNGDSDTKVERKVAGNVTVSFSLKGRSAVYLHIPAYQCENGGSVTVDIVVNQSGKVISASIDKGASTTDACLRDMAINAARLSRFNVDQKAVAKQSGTISYIFVPQ